MSEGSNGGGQAPAEIEQIDHTADVGIRVRAASPVAAFVAAAEGMFDVMVDRSNVQERQEWTVGVDAEGWDELLVAWLEELLYRWEIERMVPARITIDELDEEHLHAHIHGDRLDPEADETGVLIKAITYHQLRAEATREGFFIQVIFDI